MEIVRWANMGLRFLLELFVVGVLGYWGFHTGPTTVSILLGLAVPLVVIVVWGLFVAPQGSFDVSEAGRLELQMAVLAGALGAMCALGWYVFAAAVAAVAVLNGLLLHALRR